MVGYRQYGMFGKFAMVGIESSDRNGEVVSDEMKRAKYTIVILLLLSPLEMSILFLSLYYCDLSVVFFEQVRTRSCSRPAYSDLKQLLSEACIRRT